MFRSELISVDRLVREHPAHGDGAKRLGEKPILIEVTSGGARIEAATRAGHCDLVTGQW